MVFVRRICVLVFDNIVQIPFHKFDDPRNIPFVGAQVGTVVRNADISKVWCIVRRCFHVRLGPIGRQPLEEMPIAYDDLDPESEKGFRVHHVQIILTHAAAAFGILLRRQKQVLKKSSKIPRLAHEKRGQVLRGNNNVVFVPLMALQDVCKFLDRPTVYKIFDTKHRNVWIVYVVVVVVVVVVVEVVVVVVVVVAMVVVVVVMASFSPPPHMQQASREDFTPASSVYWSNVPHELSQFGPWP